MPAIGFLSGFGVGVTGQDSAIHANAVATDAAGDTYITGSFRGTVALDPTSSSGTYTTNNTQDTFVAKYDPAGKLLWSRTFAGQATSLPGGGTSYAVSQGSAIAVDGPGDVFVAGGFGGTVKLTGASGAITIVGPSATTEVYLAKLDPSGNVLWADPVAGTTYDNDQAYALALDGSGGAVIGGSFQDSATFGTTTLNAGGASEAFASRVDGGGHFLWAVATQGTPGSNAEIHGLAVDASGNVDLAGFFSGTVDFDPGPGTTTLASAGSDDAVLWKLDRNGQFLWARSYGSPDYDAATAVAVDGSGDLYATGAFSDTVNFGTAAHADSITAGPIFDAFVLKVDPNGNEVWAKGLVGPGGWSKGQGIAVDPTGEVDVAGTFQGLVDFDPNSGTDNLTSVGSNDVFVAGLNPAGSLVYALQAGKTNFNGALGVAVNASGIASVTGSYSGSIAFGPASVPATGVASIFVARAATQTTPPPAPSAPVLEASSDTGPSQTDGITSDTTPVFDVNTADPLDTVELLRNGVAVGQRTGPGAITDPGPVADGTYTYTALQVSPAGVAGPPSPGTPVTILTTPPPAPSAPKLVASDDTGVVGDGITSVRQPHLAVNALAYTTIQLLQASGSVLGSIYTTAGGTVLVTPYQPLADGTYVLQARAIDLAGNVGAAGPSFTLTILATPPPAPSAPSLFPGDVTGPAGGNLTSVRQPRIVGTARAGTTVEVLNASNGAILASSTAASNGSYTAKVASPLPDGTVTVDVVSVDVAANVGPASPTLTFTIDATPPAAPTALTLLAADDSGTPGDRITNVRQPRLTGKAEPGSTVQVLDGSGTQDGSTTAAGDGTFTVKLSAPLADGTYGLQARAIDLAGNVGPPGPALSLTILATPPGAPSSPTLLAQDDSGTVGDNITNVRQPRLTATAKAGLTVQLLNASNQALGTATSTASGSVTVSPSAPLADGTYALRLVAVDVAGNVSAPGGPINLVILATPPPTPAAPGLLAADDTGVLNDGITSVRRPRLVGTAAPGGRVDWIAADGSVLASATASPSNGSYQLQPPTALINGVFPAKVRETDVAGNVSLISPAFNLTVRAAAGDYFADSRTDVGVFQTSNPDYFGILRPPANGLYVIPYGVPGDVPVNGDFFGDGRDDLAFYRPSTSTFYAYDLATAATKVVQLGQAGDVPVPADFDGDGQTDFAVFRPSIGTWFVRLSTTNATFTQGFAYPGDVPVPADYLGLGHADFAVYHPSTSTFYAYDPFTGGFKTASVGAPGSIPVPADYEGLGRADFAAFRPSNLTWTILLGATNTLSSRGWGIPGDSPVLGDYFGDGRNDLTVYRASTSTFFELNLATGAVQVNQLGAPGLVKPLQAPITAWFSFGGSGGAGAIRRPGLAPSTAPTSSGLVFAIFPDPTSSTPSPAVTTSRARKASAVDRAIDALGPAGWRPGD